MKKNITLNTPNDITKIVQRECFDTLILETGEENVFIPYENKFIVTKYFLSDTSKLFAYTQINKIDMSNFDFSEITTMEWWFAYCVNLEEIIFPPFVYCNQLTNMIETFRHTNIKHFDFRNWHFKKGVKLNLTFSRSSCVSVKLGQMNINEARLTFGFCENLQEVDLGRFNFFNKNILSYPNNSYFGYLFKDCLKLKVIDSKNFTVEESTVDICEVFNLHQVLFNCNEKCVVIV